MRSGRTLLTAIAILTLASGSVSMSAHRIDEYLQAARVGIDPNRVELQLDLTPGVAVAGSVLDVIDRDGDGVLSDREQQDYVAEVLRTIEMRIDGRPLRLQPMTATFASVSELRDGEGAIRLRAFSALPHLSIGAHALSISNRHRPDVSVYLANALVPATDAIAIHGQRRDEAQTDLTIDFTFTGRAAASLPGWAIVGGTLAALLSLVVVRRT